MLRLLQTRTRLAILMLVALATATSILAPSAAADIVVTNLSGTASGIRVPQGNGTFRIAGTWTSPAFPYAVGTYRGTYTEGLPADYTSCNNLTTLGTCVGNSACNLITGQMTLSIAGNSLSLPIGSISLGKPRPQQASVCLDPVDPSVLDVDVRGSNYSGGCISAGVFGSGPVWGSVYFAALIMTGTSRPLGDGVYSDSYTLSLQTFSGCSAGDTSLLVVGVWPTTVFL
jgi:hypothetical protein